jgi:hypothetical protein
MFNTNDWLAYGATSNKFNNTYIQGILDICGNITLRSGGFSLPNGDVSMNGNLYVGIDTTLVGNVNIQGNLVVNKRVLQTLSSDPSYNSVNGYYALAKNVQPIVSKQTAYDIGQNWQSAVSGVLSHGWNSVCWSSELGLFCAVAYSVGDTNQLLMVSNDGLIWRNAVSGVVNANWHSVCWSVELRKFCAVAYFDFTSNTNNRVMTSSDGLNWINATSGVINNQWTGVCWAPELGLFCAVATNNTGTANQSVMISSAGITWSNANEGVLQNAWFRVCWAPELRLFCAVAYTGNTNQRVMISSDGLKWRNATSGVINNQWTSVCWAPELGLFCAVANTNTGTVNQFVMVSSDGLNWRNAVSGVLASEWFSVCWAPELGIFCAVSANGLSNARVMISKDGLNWINTTSVVINTLCVCWSPELSSFCAVSPSGTTNQRVMITNPIYRLPTTKSIQTLTNDGNYNINIASTSSGTFPNFRTTATGPNLISIGNGNYKLVAGALRDSIAIGNTILNVSNPSGYGIIGMGQNVFPQLTTGFQNIGIGNAIATSMATGYNNVFIGNSVATSTTSTGNTVAIGTNAGFTNATGINNTYLGAFTGANAVAYSNSTAIGYGATITASNQIKLGTANETTNIDGNLIVNKTIQTTNLTVSGTTSLSSITQSGNLIVNNTTPSYNVNSGSFQLKGGAGILGNVFINQNLSVAQNSTFSGNVSLNGIQNTFTGDVSMNGNLQVNKTSIFNGNVVINGNTFTRDVSMNGNLWIPNNATVGGDVSMNGNLTVGKNSTFTGNVSISGFSNLRDASMNGNISVSGQTTLIGNVNIQGNLVVNKRVLQTLNSDPSYNSVNGYYALAENVQPIVSKQTAYDIGQNWVNAPQIFSTQPVSLCWSPELGLFCSGCANAIVNSRDGLTWNTIVVSGGYGNSNDICWSPELRIFVVIAYNNNRCATSPDGFTWTIRTGLTTLSILDGHDIQWGSVCWSRELGLFCAVGNDVGASFATKSEAINNYCVALSSDGITWNLSTSGVKNYYWAYVCWSAELGLFCAVSFSSASNNRIMVSRDGYNWSNATNGNGSYNYIQVCWSPELGLFCATGVGNIMVSRDGYNCTPSISGVRNTTWEGVCWSPELGLFCAVSPTASTGNNEVIISRDGYNWTEATSGVAPIGWGNVCWSPELSIFCSLSYGTNTQRAMITNPIYRLPTTKTIKTLLNDGNYNINIASRPSGTFPNFRTTATGPNLISIGNGNYKLVAGALRDSIAIGNTILNGGNPNGYGIIGMGQNVFPVLTNGFQNIGIGNAIATSMTTGYNNVFIGNGVAASTSSTGNTIAIGINAGRTNTTGINNTYLGAFAGAGLGTYSNSTAIGYGATITASNEIVLGTLTEHVRTPGNPYWYSGLSQTNKLTFVANTDIAIAPAASNFQNSFSNNRITIHNTYFLVVPEFAYGIYRAQLNLNINPTVRSDIYYFKIYQYAFANATTSNIISTGTTPKNPVNSLLSRNFEFNVQTYTNDSSIDHSCLFQYAQGTTNRAFLFTWNQVSGTGDLDYYNAGANIWSWITLYKIA